MSCGASIYNDPIVYTRSTIYALRHVHVARYRASVSHLFFTSLSVFVALHALLQADLLRRGRQTDCATTSRDVLAGMDCISIAFTLRPPARFVQRGGVAAPIFVIASTWFMKTS